MKRLCVALALLSRLPAVTVPTAQYDNSRNGVNTSETVLTPANVATLVQLGSYPLDGPVYVQPLYVPSLTINGQAYNVVFVATMNNSVYALDADHPGGAALWRSNFGAAATIYGTFNRFYGGTVGVLSTPVIDVSGGFIYVVTASNTAYTLRQLNLLTGSQIASTAISGSVSGSGGGSSGGTLPFDSTKHLNRSPLTLANGKVYIGFAAGQLEADTTWHGWVFAYDASTLSFVAVFCTTPNGFGGGIWSAGGGFAVDGSGNLYFLTGNGDWNGTANFSQSAIKVNPSLVLQDWFTPSNESSTSAVDADVASGRIMLIPSTTLVTFPTKDARVWVLDSTSMGHLQGTGTAPQVFTAATITVGDPNGIYGGTFFQSNGYFSVNAQHVFSFAFSGSIYTTTAAAATAGSYSQVMMSGSSNSGSNPILWALTVSSSAFATQKPVVLHAFDPSTLVEYWNSGLVANYAKFCDPLIANGRVYVATSDGSVVAFGLPSAVVSVSVTGRPVPAP